MPVKNKASIFEREVQQPKISRSFACRGLLSHQIAHPFIHRWFKNKNHIEVYI